MLEDESFAAPQRLLNRAVRQLNDLIVRSSVVPGLLQSLQGKAFVVGTDLISSTSNIRATVENPADSGKTLIVVRLIMGHSSSGILPVQIIRGPTTNLPTQTWPSLNQHLGDPTAPVAVVKADSGSAMGGGDGGAFLPVAGNIPAAFNPTPPFAIPEGNIVGLTAQVGATLSSADVLLTLSFVEMDNADVTRILESQA